jgi:hypothetical protein
MARFPHEVVLDIEILNDALIRTPMVQSLADIKVGVPHC